MSRSIRTGSSVPIDEDSTVNTQNFLHNNVTIQMTNENPSILCI